MSKNGVSYQATLYALPKSVLIGILILNIDRLTGSKYKKNYLTGTHYKKISSYRNLSSLIRRSNHLYFGKPFTDMPSMGPSATQGKVYRVIIFHLNDLLIIDILSASKADA